MRLAGTWTRYSKKAIPQLMPMATGNDSPFRRRWPYHAMVMKVFDTTSNPAATNASDMPSSYRPAARGRAPAVPRRNLPGRPLNPSRPHARARTWGGTATDPGRRKRHASSEDGSDFGGDGV